MFSELLPHKPQIMGVVNITPDSFSDGGKYNNKEQALERINKMISDGADIIDIGCQSTRPGANNIGAESELERIIPILEMLCKEFTNIKISIDTFEPKVITEALKYDIYMINNIYAFTNDNSTLSMIKENNTKVCLMHIQNHPYNMQDNPQYTNVVTEVYDFLKRQITKCKNYGIPLENIFIDPGFGYGKKLHHNLELLRNLYKFNDLGCGTLVGMSRKGMLGKMTGKASIQDRIHAHVTAVTLAILQGVKIIRTHDIVAIKDACEVMSHVANKEYSIA